MIDLESGLGWALLARGKTARALRALLRRTGDPETVLGLSPKEAAEISAEPEEVVAPLLTPKSAPGIAEQRTRLSKANARLVLLSDPDFPPLLREIPDPPPVLFVRGGSPDDRVAVAVVGARRASRAGLDAARLLAGDLARTGVVVVSGFARGIDAAAHRAALAAGGTTVAVLGCGVDICYPPEQEKLFEEIARAGTIYAEFPMGTTPEPWLFPIRNRVIAGMSCMTLVVEAAQKSGSLITARCAADYGRDVAAVPGSILSPVAEGSNALLKDGAILVRNAQDVLAELPGRFTVPAGTREKRDGDVSLDPDALSLFGALDPDEPRDADALAETTGLPAGRLSAALVMLELEGLAESLGGAVFVRRREKI